MLNYLRATVKLKMIDMSDLLEILVEGVFKAHLIHLLEFSVLN